MGKKNQTKQTPASWGIRKPRKDNSVFKVAGSKVTRSKHKAKPVTTTIKKLDRKARTDASTAKADEDFSTVRESLVKGQKDKADIPTVAEHKKDLPQQSEVPDITQTLKDFAKL